MAWGAPCRAAAVVIRTKDMGLTGANITNELIRDLLQDARDERDPNRELCVTCLTALRAPVRVTTTAQIAERLAARQACADEINNRALLWGLYELDTKTRWIRTTERGQRRGRLPDGYAELAPLAQSTIKMRAASAQKRARPTAT
jgi:hypothetical protein